MKTRFAPSPTGYMHIGNLRSALYNYLIAKSMKGKFILRIEDTDQTRQIEGAEQVIYDTLNETGLLYDEGPDVGGDYGPYIQSQRKEIYQKYAGQLVESKNAYYCFCEKSDDHSLNCNCRNLSDDQIKLFMDQKKSYVIRQYIPKIGSTGYDDLVFGHVEIDNSELEDQILIKSDGMPTYNFANVVDDHLMQITHVVRGCEYLSATPKYNLLYKSFGWDIPVYAHLPLIMGKNPDGTVSKLSKRAGAVSFVDLLNEGFLSESIINYIALLGWCPDSNNEIFSLEDLEKEFSIDRIGKSPSIFDYEKLAWVNEQHIKMKSDSEFASIIKKYVDFDINLEKLAKILKPRVSKLTQIPEMIDFFKSLPSFDKSLFINKKNKTNEENTPVILKNSISLLESIEDWANDNLFSRLSELADSLNLKKNSIMWVIRIAISGKSVTPGGATEILDILGKSESIRRLKLSLEMFNI